MVWYGRGLHRRPRLRHSFQVHFLVLLLLFAERVCDLKSRRHKGYWVNIFNTIQNITVGRTIQVKVWRFEIECLKRRRHKGYWVNIFNTYIPHGQMKQTDYKLKWPEGSAPARMDQLKWFTRQRARHQRTMSHTPHGLHTNETCITSGFRKFNIFLRFPFSICLL